MKGLTLIRRTLLATAPLTLNVSAIATDPIRLIVPNPPGGPLDLVARALADKLRDNLCVVIAKYERVVKASGAKVE